MNIVGPGRSHPTFQQRDNECARMVLITALVVSLLFLLGGIINLTGLTTVRAFPAAVWTLFSGFATMGCIYLLLRRERPPPQSPPKTQSFSPKSLTAYFRRFVVTPRRLSPLGNKRVRRRLFHTPKKEKAKSK